MEAPASPEAAERSLRNGPNRRAIRRNMSVSAADIRVLSLDVAAERKNMESVEQDNFGDKVDGLAANADWFHSTLLASVAHDLRTPLTSILGSATTLRAYRQNLNEADQDNLIGLIQGEAERLNRFIANLLHLVRLGAGMIEPHLDLVPLDDIIGAALERARLVLANHRVVVDLAIDLPMLRLDPVLFEQVIFNLLENAAKYALSGTEVRLTARHQAGLVRLEVLDEGQGIPPGELERIFDKFYRIRQVHPKLSGTGLGLSICRGFVQAMGGTIVAANRPDRTGSVFTIAFRR
jgi:two-component system, OmpR family, sensor histidine kinase KdpD